jgi:B12-binding domain/radical SAM domain protein
MFDPDLILLHPPTIFNFRERPTVLGPISDVVPSTSVLEIYPIGFITISEYLHRHGISVRIINLAMKMIKDDSFSPEKLIRKLNPRAFGIDLHWLAHADGSLALAELISRIHPEKPVILGGLSATYYHDEIMRDYPFVDFIVRGDSTEEPLRMLMESLKSQGRFESIPNLVWKNEKGNTIVNDLSCRPDNLDYINYDFKHILKSAIKYRDLQGYLPFRNWLTYPVTAVFQCRGCTHNCCSCAGSLLSFRQQGIRERPCFRSPELLAQDIKKISDFTGSPVMVIGDLLQGGEGYAHMFLESIKKYNIENEIALEFFDPPPEAFIKKIADSIRNFNFEISPESHDPGIREHFGKCYGNEKLETSIETFISHGARRVDLFFMVGLPYQDYSSVIETVHYCESLLERYGSSGKLLPLISPLAPFVDPGSRIFENPDKFGYKLFYRTLREHREAMLKLSWKYTLNYETIWMTRDDIVMATYDAASLLAQIKVKYGMIDEMRAQTIMEHIEQAKDLIRKIDGSHSINESVMEEVMRLNNHDILCDKHELEWPLKGWKLALFTKLLIFSENFMRRISRERSMKT